MSTYISYVTHWKGAQPPHSKRCVHRPPPLLHHIVKGPGVNEKVQESDGNKRMFASIQPHARTHKWEMAGLSSAKPPFKQQHPTLLCPISQITGQLSDNSNTPRIRHFFPPGRRKEEEGNFIMVWFCRQKSLYSLSMKFLDKKNLVLGNNKYIILLSPARSYDRWGRLDHKIFNQYVPLSSKNRRKRIYFSTND